jgi:hypothetical protein
MGSFKDTNVADSKREETFKVIDRRLFTEQGELRKDVVEEEHREEEAKEEASRLRGAASGPGGASAQEPNSRRGEDLAGAPPAQGEPQKDETSGETSASSHSFQMLVDFLTRNAAAMLGGIADPRTGQAFIDLEGAREVIDMFDTLREKTRGNLSKADEDLLVEVIGSLKLTFMEVSQAAAEAMAKKAGGKK